MSREILSASLFGVGWLVVTAETLIFQRTTPILLWLVSILGFYLVHSISQVYRLPAKPAWDTWRTNTSFMVSALLLGQLAMALVLSFESQMTGVRLPNWNVIGLITLALLVLQSVMTSKYHLNKTTRVLHVGSILTAMAATAITFLFIKQPSISSHLFVFLAVLTEEITGRWLFYNQQSTDKISH